MMSLLQETTRWGSTLTARGARESQMISFGFRVYSKRRAQVKVEATTSKPIRLAPGLGHRLLGPKILRTRVLCCINEPSHVYL